MFIRPSVVSSPPDGRIIARYTCTICLYVFAQEPVATRRRAHRPAEGQVRGADIQSRRFAENEQHVGGKREKSVYRRDP